MQKKLLWTFAAATTGGCLLVAPPLAMAPLVVVAMTLGKDNPNPWFLLAAIALSTMLPHGVDILFIFGFWAFVCILDAIHRLQKTVEEVHRVGNSDLR